MIYVDVIYYVNALASPLVGALEGYEPMRSNGNLIYSVGGGGVTFKVSRDGKPYALKFFTTISDELLKILAASSQMHNHSSLVVNYQFIEQAICVDNWEERLLLPAVVMDWVDGMPLCHYLRQLCYVGNRAMVGKLLDRFLLFAHKLLSSSIIHSDIKGENILTNGESFMLIDPDGITDKSANLCHAALLHSPWYNHPKMVHFSRMRDHYPIAILVASMVVGQSNPDLITKYNDGDNLLFDPAMLTLGVDSAFAQAKDIFTQDVTLVHLGEYICSQDCPVDDLTPLLFDIMVRRRIACYPVIDPKSDVQIIKGYKGLYGYCDNMGRVILSPAYRAIKPFVGERGAVLDGGLWYFVDKLGQRISQQGYLQVSSFSCGFAAVRAASGWGYIGECGSLFTSLTYDMAKPFKNSVGLLIIGDNKYEVNAQDLANNGYL